MKKIDSHQHFWVYDPKKHDWIDDSMFLLKQDFLPADLKKIYGDLSFDGCVAVQADQTEEETDFLLSLAANNDFIRGVVGWVDLRADNIEERLAHFSKFEKLKGFRHVVQGESDPKFMQGEAFMRGIAALGEHDFTYDILIFAHQLKSACQLALDFPNQAFVIDHIAKPKIAAKEIETWKADISVFQQLENVSCKISGMVTEANWKDWSYDELGQYLDVVFETFGEDRLMFGSDWPVCLLAGSYNDIQDVLETYLTNQSEETKQKLWATNACNFYKIKE